MTPSENHWYKDAIIYEVHVRAFRDENGDGIGDFRGMTSKLDYLRDLGVTALWLLPFYPSPLKDDGYDIADYKSINPAYGTMRDFRRFLREAHARDLKVITELVINHTSDQHPWFQRARRAPEGSWERDFYVWSDNTELYQDARIIFQDTETSNWSWDPVAEAYYWHRFFSHQPDLNFENPDVHEAIFDVLEFWLDMGVDGLRLDAVPYLYERDGTMCENLPETHQFLKELRARVDSKYEARMLLAEANQWPEDSVEYFGDGDECHMAFHFPLMPRLFMALRQESRFPIVDILEQTPEIPETAQWATFLRNHDELTLEMVTDEERDYMYRVYAGDPQMRINVGIRRRLAPLLGNNRREIELMNGLLLSLPGTPAIYYGDEIGMGDNIYLGDRNGVRTPMQWSGDRNAGFSEANSQRLYFPVITDLEYHFESVNVEVQHDNPNSLWWWMRRTLAVRKSLPALSQGRLEFVTSDNPKVLTFLRRTEDSAVLVVANLSRHPQPTRLDLSEFVGYEPIEVVGRSRFPMVEEEPYVMSVGPHDFYWFALERVEEGELDGHPRVNLRGELAGVWRARTQLQRALVSDISHRRWFRSKAQTIRDGELIDLLELPGTEARIAFLRLDYVEADSEVYVIPLAATTGAEAETLAVESPGGVIAELAGLDEPAILYDAMRGEDLPRALLSLAGSRRKLRGKRVNVYSGKVPGSTGLARKMADSPVRAADLEQTNTSVYFDHDLIMKLFRKVEAGPNPEVEVGRFLSEKAGYPNTPPAKALVVAQVDGHESALAFAQEFVPSQGNAFDHVFDNCVLTLENIVARRDELGNPPRPGHPLDVTGKQLEVGHSMMSALLVDAGLLGTRTGEMHLALASDPDDPVFAPEPLSTLQQRSLYQAIRSAVRASTTLLKRKRSQLRPQDAELVDELLGVESQLLNELKSITSAKIACDRIRIHGDYHLGQVLHTGKDFVIIDFEGEPQRPLSQRRIKRLALRDVAGMIRSYHYVTLMAFHQVVQAGLEESRYLDDWAHTMHRWLSASFLEGYMDVVVGSSVVPADPGQFRLVLDALLVEKAAYELEYEVNNRPDWVEIPLRGILETIE